VSRATSASSVASESNCGWEFKLGEWIVDDPVPGAKQSVGQLDLVRRWLACVRRPRRSPARSTAVVLAS
jgi:hypothetical protein